MPDVPQPPRPVRHVLTAVEFEVLWTLLGLGSLPVGLSLPGSVRDEPERRAGHVAGWAGLRARGLVGASGPDPELVRLLHLLAAPTAVWELRCDAPRPLRAVAATGPEVAALAVRQDATLTVAACGTRPVSLRHQLLAMAPGGDPVPCRLTARARDATGVLRPADDPAG